MFVIRPRFLFFKHRQHPHFLSTVIHANRANLQQIYEHPFNQQLFNGTLSPTLFGRYLRDDYYYLQHFSSILQKLSVKTAAINPDLAIHLDYLAKDIIDNERHMQRQYKEHLQDLACYTPGPAISSYIKFLSHTSTQAEPAVGLSAVLPCFWIYHELGKRNKHSSFSSANIYKNWIETYSDPDFIKATLQLAKTVTLLDEQSPPKIQVKMKAAFSSAVQFELNFFDEAGVPGNGLDIRKIDFSGKI